MSQGGLNRSCLWRHFEPAPVPLTGVQNHSTSLSCYVWFITQSKVIVVWVSLAFTAQHETVITNLSGTYAGRLVMTAARFLMDPELCVTADRLLFFISVTAAALWVFQVPLCQLQPGSTWPFFQGFAFSLTPFLLRMSSASLAVVLPVISLCGWGLLRSFCFVCDPSLLCFLPEEGPPYQFNVSQLEWLKYSCCSCAVPLFIRICCTSYCRWTRGWSNDCTKDWSK